MKIGVISDLHIDNNSNEQVSIVDYERSLENEAIEQNIELLLIAGDISNDHVMSHQFIENVKQRINVPVLFVPGNHDYWSVKQEEKDTHEILAYFKEQEESIIENPYIINDEWAVVGHSGWYDYTFAHKRFTTEELSEKSHNGRVWKDKLHIDWNMSDQALSKKFAADVQADLEKVKDKKIILMTHFVTHKGFGVQMPHQEFDYFNAFIGSSDYNSFFQDYDIKYNIMGHVHYRRTDRDELTHICACLGNRNEWESDDLATEVHSAFQVIEI